MPRLHRHLAAALVAPPVFALLCPLGVAVAEWSGTQVFTAIQPLNLAEAASIGRADDVVRRVREGEDRFRVYQLRPELISSAVLRATPTEAAMWSRQLLMIHLLDREGAIEDGAHRHQLACLAADLELDDVVAYLSPGAAPDCVPQQARDRVLARTAGDGAR